MYDMRTFLHAYEHMYVCMYACVRMYVCGSFQQLASGLISINSHDIAAQIFC